MMAVATILPVWNYIWCQTKLLWRQKYSQFDQCRVMLPVIGTTKVKKQNIIMLLQGDNDLDQPITRNRSKRLISILLWNSHLIRCIFCSPVWWLGTQTTRLVFKSRVLFLAVYYCIIILACNRPEKFEGKKKQNVCGRHVDAFRSFNCRLSAKRRIMCQENEVIILVLLHSAGFYLHNAAYTWRSVELHLYISDSSSSIWLIIPLKSLYMVSEDEETLI